MTTPADLEHDDDWEHRSACRQPGVDGDWFYPTRPAERADDDSLIRFLPGGDNHGREAKRICQGCPVRTQCLEDAMGSNEQYAIRAGAGGGARRALRRAWVVDGPDGPEWTQAAATHFALLDGEPVPVPDTNGPDAVCGLASTYARGCRCAPCCLAVGVRGAIASIRRGARRSTTDPRRTAA